MSVRYEREEEFLASSFKRVGGGLRDVQRATGTERLQTSETAVAAWDQSEFAKDLAEQLQGELGPLPGQIQDALAESAAALAAAGLAQSEAAAAVADAAQAAADATEAIEEAIAAAALVAGSNTWADRAPVAADADGKPLGAVWFQMDVTGLLDGFWELQSLGWISRDMSETVIPQIAIGTGTYGSLSGSRLVARSILAGHIAALAITAEELASDSVTAVKIAANSVTAEKINAGAVTTVKLDALAVTAEKIAVGAIIAEKIAAGAITAGKIAATAIDGMTITGALIRTAVSGQRMQLDINGLRAFDSGDVQRALLAASSGGLLLSGTLTSYIGGNTQRAVLSNGALTFDYVGSPGAGTMTLGPGGIDSNDSNARFKIRKQSSAPGVGLDIVAGSGGSNTASILMDGESGGKIRFNAAKVEFQGDRPWARIASTTYGPAIGTLGSGVTHLVGAPYDGLQARIKSGVLYITGAIQRTGGFPMNYVLFTLNNPYRTAAAAVQYAYSGGHNFILASQIDGTVVVAVTSSSPVMYLGLTIPLD